MVSILQILSDNPVIAAIAFAIAVALFLAILFGVMMRRSASSLRPLVFFFTYLAIIAGPQASVHLLNAYLNAKAKASEDKPADSKVDKETTASGIESLRPVSWQTVFGPKAGPDLISDAKLGLGEILAAASEAKISFNVSGESALAARFETPADTTAALRTYIRFFQLGNVSGSDAFGWTGQRFQGQGEWNHVVVADNELYAWTGPSRESVVTNRVRALGTFVDTPASSSALQASDTQARPAPATEWLLQHPLAFGAFIGINLLLAIGWFFRGSAWATRVSPDAHSRAVDPFTLRERVLALNKGAEPLNVHASTDGRKIEIDWRYGDARWFDLMRIHKMHRTHRLVLSLDESNNTVRVREYRSAFDASAGAGKLDLSWRGAMGMNFFNVERVRVLGVQLDEHGRPTGKLSKEYTFNVQAMRQPIINVVVESGWAWQPVMLDSPPSLRWLTA